MALQRFLQRRGRQPSDQTVRARICALSSFYSYLSDYGLLLDDDGGAAANPMSAIESPRIEVGPPDWLKPEEDAKLLGCQMDDAGEDHHLSAADDHHACRGGACPQVVGCRLRGWDDPLEKSKFGKSRIIPIVPELLPHLRHWAAVLKGKGVFARNAPVLCARNGTPMVTQHIEKLVARVRVRAELQDRLHPHKLRKTFGSNLLNRRLRIEVVSALLGHSHVGITQKYYASLLDSTIRAEVMAALGA